MEIIKDKILIILIGVLVVVISIFIFILLRPNKTPTTEKDSTNTTNSNNNFENKSKDESQIRQEKNDNYNLSDFYSDNNILDSKVDSVFKSLSDRQIAGQVIVQAAGEYGRPYTVIETLIQKNEIGGVLLLKGNQSEFKSQISALNETVKKSKSIPLIFSCDAEPSLINKKISGAPHFPKTSSIKTEKDAAKVSEDITKYIKGLGFNQNFAPVCDFNTNKEIIGDRSFGSTTESVSALANVFIKSSQDNNVIATAKHFPGHGNVSGDSHKSLVTIKGEPSEIETFRKVINGDVLSVMIGHIAIEGSKKYDTNGRPSTISKNIITNLLKEELKFKGLIITDAMNMKGVTSFTAPSLEALKSGCDMVLMPTDEAKLLNSILEYAKKDEKFKEQLSVSVKKILRLKFCLGLFKNN